MWEYETDHEELKVAILRAHVVPLGRDNLGELCGGALQIVCQTIVYGELRNCEEKDEDCWREEEIHLSDNPEHYSLNVCWDSSDTRSSLFDVTVAFTRVCLLPITSLAGLILAVTGRKRGEYRRLGYFNGPSERIWALFQKMASVLEEDLYVSYLEDDRYVDKHLVIEVV